MTAQKASRSAGIIAAHRAIESAKATDERICHDPLARDFLPPGFTVIGETEIPEDVALKIFKSLVPGFHEHFLARTRYIDEYLQDFIDRGLRQLVILGAGYDTRAYRLDGLKQGIKILEVDHPGTQAAKTEKLKEIFQALPDHVTFVPVDLRTESLQTALLENGYDPSLQTLFIWEGVTMYIDEESVDKTLSFISKNSGRESAVIFDYTLPEVIDGTHDRKEAVEWLKIASKSPEPLLFGIGHDQIEPFLKERGFDRVTSITSDYFKRHYFTGVNQDRESTPILALAHAEVRG